MKGFDAAQPVGGIVSKIGAAGCGFVGRYYSHNIRKNLSPREARDLSTAGISIVTVWEAAGDQAVSFNANRGTKDAVAARACAVKVGQPSATTIYFAVDFDATHAQITERIVPYFRAIAHEFVGQYFVGVYGSGLVCSELKTQGLVLFTWLGGAMGWNGSRAFADWDIKQGLPGDPYHFGFQVDPDEARGDHYGQWRLDVPAIPTAEIHPILRLTSPMMTGDAVRELQRGLSAAGQITDIDGVFGEGTEDALIAFQTANGLTEDGICGSQVWTALRKNK